MALFEQLFHPHAQFIAVEGLVEVGIGTGFESLDAVGFRSLGGDHDDRHVADKFRFAHVPAEFQTVHLGHHQVGDDKVRHDAFCLLYSQFAVGGIEKVITVG